DSIILIENINLDNPNIKNRADESIEKNIDFYITEEEFKKEKTKILVELKNFTLNFNKIKNLDNEDDIIKLLDKLFNENYNNTTPIAIIPNRPYYNCKLWII
ncbi:MAG: hypothetical protein LBQ59_01180, partial [Candidatus Peribacteria bacterium]|nr:hypothetical protein [Candidatus Peribacteria bacterium]